MRIGEIVESSKAQDEEEECRDQNEDKQEAEEINLQKGCKAKDRFEEKKPERE